MLARCLLALIVITLFAMPQTINSANAQQRGIQVSYKASEARNAPVEGTVTLYPKSYALVIGNDLYSNGWSRLSNGVKDAEEVSSALQDIGFQVTLKTNLTRREFASSIEDWIFEYGGDSDARLFIWYAGHGHTDSSGEGYLVPVDAPSPAKGEFAFKRYALNMRNFGTWVRTAQSRHVYAVFDSCFAGTVFNSARAAPPSAITLATTRPVRQFLTSGDADQTVSDDGTFRRLFVEALRGERRADANGDGYLTASELGLFLGDQVTNLSNGAQTPRHGKLRDPNYNRGDFVFAQLRTGALPAPGVAAPTNAAPGVSSRDIAAQIDLETWQSIKGTGNKLLLEDYVSRSEAGKLLGQFVMLAKAELARLSNPAPKPVPAVNTAARDDLYQKGSSYYYGKNGTAKDYNQAYTWFKKAADQGHPKAQDHLGVMYDNGRGVSKNHGTAISWFKKAAEQGYATSQKNMGIMYEYGRGIPKDYAQALKWYQLAARQGDMKAQGRIGVLYDNGRGVPKDHAEAVRWFRSAAEQGYVTAQKNLGIMYEYGRGIEQDYSEALRWFKKAADQGNAEAKGRMAVLYDNGRGTSKNQKEALRLFHEAANLGYVESMKNLGIMYEYGRGTKKNLTEAKKWYRKAADKGNEKAIAALKRLKAY